MPEPLPQDAVTATALLRLENVSWRAPDGRLVLDQVSLSLAPGELAWLRGPSGGGKSSLLRLINRLAEPSDGLITLLGKPLAAWEPPQLRRHVGLLAQSPVMLPGTVEHNLSLAFGFKSAQGQTAPDQAALRGALDRLGLEGVELGASAPGLSLGQRQRLALARLLLLDPQVLLLDEPVSALDPESKELVETTAAAQAGQGRAVLLVSHQPPPQAQSMRRLILEQGHLREEGS
ncbi:MAG: ATP-binding cassette domain-containing protein [Desulfarculaceae bacterium]|nr:ATP-binding cassette domain-containing protein [Desulfarculaceae bacterium]MCF8048989.1 ATP-binding cassette domain-containing protein [Desulfarculaceae bacterium]MCF8065501.1 ATP-binding cassette domain-containing protein [Desulfarculaceae bacterium]MCF8124441.1 ATP-binding cassette domain-containing protein [Desulfarculaceae bacterium]